MFNRASWLMALGLLHCGFAFTSATGQEPPKADALPEGALRRLGISALRGGGEFKAFALLPDGTRALTTGDGGVQMWDLRSGLITARCEYPERVDTVNLKIPESTTRAELLASDGSGIILVRQGVAYRYPLTLQGKPVSFPTFGVGG